MRDVFVETRNYRTFMEKMTRVDERGAEEACLVVVDGKPGLGKTATMDHWVSQTGSIYLRAQSWWEHNDFIAELLNELGTSKPPPGRRERFVSVIKELSALADQAALEDRTFSIVIDECDMISRKTSVMETIRGISDIKFLPTILVGMGTLRDHLRRFPQIESRAPNKASFEPSSLADATALIEGLCEVPVAPDLINYAWRSAKGFSREMVEAISKIERFGRRIEIGPQGVTMADMAGQVLMSNRDTKQDIIVPVGA
ncbi:MAG: DNA transposition protein [Rhodobacterales bacterium 65-51]|uniref:AAA family ATPase n=1 Tax=uncultured Gemmobacter sp. TaxID=1095917 RepID=UPI00095C3D07|nr:ATP-binding protein [uncultured Gemmobacter sp.]OJY36339.1 MAG: DNA transposition protein [Rhodobacterales bacterium 65-51]